MKTAPILLLLALMLLGESWTEKNTALVISRANLIAPDVAVPSDTEGSIATAFPRAKFKIHNDPNVLKFFIFDENRQRDKNLDFVTLDSLKEGQRTDKLNFTLPVDSFLKVLQKNKVTLPSGELEFSADLSTGLGTIPKDGFTTFMGSSKSDPYGLESFVLEAGEPEKVLEVFRYLTEVPKPGTESNAMRVFNRHFVKIPLSVSVDTSGFRRVRQDGLFLLSSRTQPKASRYLWYFHTENAKPVLTLLEVLQMAIDAKGLYLVHLSAACFNEQVVARMDDYKEKLKCIPQKGSICVRKSDAADVLTFVIGTGDGTAGEGPATYELQLGDTPTTLDVQLATRKNFQAPAVPADTEVRIASALDCQLKTLKPVTPIKAK